MSFTPHKPRPIHKWTTLDFSPRIEWIPGRALSAGMQRGALAVWYVAGPTPSQIAIAFTGDPSPRGRHFATVDTGMGLILHLFAELEPAP